MEASPAGAGFRFGERAAVAGGIHVRARMCACLGGLQCKPQMPK